MCACTYFNMQYFTHGFYIIVRKLHLVQQELQITKWPWKEQVNTAMRKFLRSLLTSDRG